MGEQIPENMRAARVTEFGKSEYEIQEIPVPKPKGYEILIKVGAAGFCHTDAMVYEGQFKSMGSSCPITGSHEPAGTVVAMGPDAEKLGKQKIGDRIGAENMMGPCGKCSDCTVFKDPTYCPNLDGMAGITKDGGFAEYCLLDSRTAAKLPDQMSFEQAAPLMCAGVTIYAAIKKAEACGLKEGGAFQVGSAPVKNARGTTELPVLGLGALGHLGVQFAKCMGYKVVGIDARPEPIDLAKSLKYPPDLVLDATKMKAEDALPKVKELDPSKPFEGLDAVILLADPQSSVDYAVALTARHGLVVLVSQPEKGINLQFYDVIFRDIRLVGSLLGKQQYLQETVDLCANHGIESHIASYKLDDINKMVKDNHSDKKKGKTVITFS